MSNAQRWVVVAWAVAVILIGLFPPCWHSGPDGASAGHEFLLATGQFSSGRRLYLVEPGRLLAYWGIVTAAAVAACILVSGRERGWPA
jgi:hypothetical protein